MPTCHDCGLEVTWITTWDGRRIAIHPGGMGCPARTGWGNYGSWIHVRKQAGVEFEFPFVNRPSYLNPNARCPKCNQAVFFYQSADGRQVLLEELGPPWLTHRCWEVAGVRREFGNEETWEQRMLDETAARIAGAERPEAEWRRTGWVPLVVRESGELSVAGIWAKGTIHPVTAILKELGLKQDHADATYRKSEKGLVMHFRLVVNTHVLMKALVESPVLARRSEAEAGQWEMSSFVLDDGEVVPLEWGMGENCRGSGN